MLVLPCKAKSERGQRIIKSINKVIKKILPQNHVIQNVYKSEKLGSYFNIKDSTKLEHQHDLSYLTQCPEVNCNETYFVETARKLRERDLDRNNSILSYLRTLSNSFQLTKLLLPLRVLSTILLLHSLFCNVAYRSGFTASFNIFIQL